MPSKYENKRDHVLREPLEKAVARALAGNADTAQLVESVLMELDNQNLISYVPRGTISLLTPAGRVVSLLLETPGLTVREMSVTIGCSITAVQKAISVLDKDGLVRREKTDGRYEYFVDHEKARYHHDLRRLVSIVASISAAGDTPG